MNDREAVPVRLRCAVLVALLGLALACHPTVSPEPLRDSERDREARIEEVVGGLARPVQVVGREVDRLDLGERMEWFRVPGVAVAVVDGGEVAWEQGFGVLKAGGEGRVTAETPFQAASISKPVVAVGVLRLVAAGHLGLDDPVNRWLEGWQVPEGGAAPASEVTVRRLLSHSGGFTNGAVGAYAPDASLPTLLEALDGLPPSTEPPALVEYPPGSRFKYSGAGYDVLQQMIVDLDGGPFHEAMARWVLTPARMARSTFEQPLPAAWADAAARGHDGSGHPLEGGWKILPEAAAGGLWSTAGDLGRFLAVVAESWRDGGLLPRASARLMGEPQVGPWGLGFEVAVDGGEVRLEHTGSNPGYRGIVVLYPARDQGAVVLTNGEGGDALRGELLRAIARAYDWPGYGVEEVLTVPWTERDFDDWVGRYDYGGGYATTLLPRRPGAVSAAGGGPAHRGSAGRPR